jgi:hypothetical protein
MLDNAIVFETNRLSIRKYSVSDALALFNILQEKDILTISLRMLFLLTEH